MYRLLFGITAVILILSTLCAGLMKPQMHKSVMIYDSEYKIVEMQKDNTIERDIPTQTNVAKTQKTAKKTDTPVAQKQISTPVVQLTKQEKIKKSEPQTEVAAKQTAKTAQKIKEAEELILWNKWRSQLQNQIMMDVQLPIMPQGTTFKFTFDVDKYGKISNVKTWSTTPAFTPYAIQFIAPVIRSYQGHSILNFPEGSSRISTTVEGGWKISQTSKYSTPNDYKDTEKIRK